MPDRTHSHPVRLRFRALASALAAWFAVAGVLIVASCSRRVPPDAVRVHLDEVPPDACLALFGPGPCRPHGAAPTTGWTDAVAGPPPARFREPRP